MPLLRLPCYSKYASKYCTQKLDLWVTFREVPSLDESQSSFVKTNISFDNVIWNVKRICSKFRGIGQLSEYFTNFFFFRNNFLRIRNYYLFYKLSECGELLSFSTYPLGYFIRSLCSYVVASLRFFERFFYTVRPGRGSLRSFIRLDNISREQNFFVIFVLG